MKLPEIQAIFAAIQGASDSLQLKVSSAMYAIESARKDLPEPISEQRFNEMWTDALGRQIEGHATIIQARHLLTLIEAYYGIERRTE